MCKIKIIHVGRFLYFLSIYKKKIYFNKIIIVYKIKSFEKERYISHLNLRKM